MIILLVLIGVVFGDEMLSCCAVDAKAFVVAVVVLCFRRLGMVGPGNPTSPCFFCLFFFLPQSGPHNLDVCWRVLGLAFLINCHVCV